MKKTGLLLLLCLAMAVAVAAQQADSPRPTKPLPRARCLRREAFPMERVQTPTVGDLYCGGFVSKDLVPNANFVAGGLESPNTTKFARNDLVFLAGSGYQTGQQYEIVRELQDPNRYELFCRPTFHVEGDGPAVFRIGPGTDRRHPRQDGGGDTLNSVAKPIVPGDFAIPFAEKPAVAFHPPQRFDRFMPSNGKASGRIVLAKDFDLLLGTGSKFT